MHLYAAAREFLRCAAAIVEKVRRDTVDGLTFPPSQRVILKASRYAWAAEADKLLVSVPSVGGRA